MGRKDRIKEERIRYWIKFLSVFLVLSIAFLLVFFYFYNRNIMKESSMKIDELASVERIILNDNLSSETYDSLVDVSTSDDKTVNEISNTLVKGTLEVNDDSSKNKSLNNVKKEENKNIIEKEKKVEETKSEEIELSKINAINNEITNEIR